jgi:hypothetical protein
MRVSIDRRQLDASGVAVTRMLEPMALLVASLCLALEEHGRSGTTPSGG